MQVQVLTRLPEAGPVQVTHVYEGRSVRRALIKDFNFDPDKADAISAALETDGVWEGQFSRIKLHNLDA